MDQTGVVTEPLDKLKERLDKRQREFKSQQSWFEGIYTFGPCILNRLTKFVKDRLSVIQATGVNQPIPGLKANGDRSSLISKWA